MKIYITRFLILLQIYFSWANEQVFDIHVHIWNGETSVKEYLSKLDSTGQSVIKFGSIHIAY